MTEISGQRRAPHTGTLGGRPLALLLAETCQRAAYATLTLISFQKRAVVRLRAGRVIDVEVRTRRSQDIGADLEALFLLPPETTFALREDDAGMALDFEGPSVDPWPAIWRGLVENPPRAHVERAMTRLGGAMRLGNVAIAARLDLDEDERTVCEFLADRPRTLGETVVQSPLGAERTHLLVYCLGLARALDVHAVETLGPTDLGADGIRERARTIADASMYATLGLASGSSIEAVRAAFFRLARAWHPERLPAALEEVREECSHVFTKIALAYDRIREAEAESWSIRPPAPSATASMREVDEALARADFARADTLARALAKTVVDGPNARAVIAWCEAEAGASIERAIGALDRILAGDPQCARAIHYRAKLSARRGLTADAIRDYRRLLRIAPHYEHAHDELRALARSVAGDALPHTSGLRRLHEHLLG